MLAAQAVRSASVRSQQAVEQDPQYEKRDRDVQIVMLEGECHRGKCNSRHRGSNQNQQSELDNCASPHVECAMNDPAHGCQRLRLAAKDAIGRNLVTVAREIYDGTEYN